MAAVQFFSDLMKAAIAELVDAQLALALIPTENKRVVVVHVDKTGGGSRPLSLFEEMTKAVEGVISKRLDAVCLRAEPGSIVTASNHAYQIGRSTLQPIAVDAIAREDAVSAGKEIVRIQGDLDAGFDVLNRVVADVDMGARGYPEVVRQLFAELYTDQMCHIVTPWGLSSGVARGEIGVGQGAISSPRISLHAQNAATRIIDDMLRTHGYVLEGGTRVLQANYSDDWLWLVGSWKSAKHLLAEASLVWKELAVPNKPGKLFAIYNRGASVYFEKGDAVLVIVGGIVSNGVISAIEGDHVTVSTGPEQTVVVSQSDILPQPLAVDLWSPLAFCHHTSFNKICPS